MSAAKFLAILSIGVVAGASVALICAPQTGEKARRRLRRGLEDAGDYLKDATDTFSSHLEKYAKRGRGIADNVADTASSTYTAARKAMPI